MADPLDLKIEIGDTAVINLSPYQGEGRRREQEALEARVAALEAALFDLQKSALKPRRTRKPATSL